MQENATLLKHQGALKIRIGKPKKKKKSFTLEINIRKIYKV